LFIIKSYKKYKIQNKIHTTNQEVEIMSTESATSEIRYETEKYPNLTYTGVTVVEVLAQLCNNYDTVS